jgi:hypothetical protein
MSRGRLVSMGAMTILLGLVGLTASASAAITFQWKVGGAVLGAGASKSFTSTTDATTITLKGSLAGREVLLLSNKIAVDKAFIFGGTPGTGEETVLFEKVVVDKPEKCTAETAGVSNPSPGIIETEPLLITIVQSRVTGEPLILFTPKTGADFVTIKFLSKTGETCPVAGGEGTLVGSYVAVPEPQLAETLNGTLGFESETDEFLLSGGGNAVEKSGLMFAGNAAIIHGLTLNVLTTDEKYGAF